MLTLLIRRLLWTVPTLFVVSLLTFSVLSFVPPRADVEVPELRRAHFLDLPRFVNFAPQDARTRARAAARAIGRDDANAAAAGRELARLGGAALPHVIPLLDEFESDRQREIALALAPIARRMRVAGAEQAADPDRAVGFWRRFWDDRNVEFRPAAVRTAVDRLTRYGTASRAGEVEEVDTFALPAIFERLPMPRDGRSIGVARTLVGVAAHVTERDDRIPEDASLEDAQAVVLRWRAWWLVHESDYATFDGVTRVSAMLEETRYGKWAAGAVQDAATRDFSELALGKIARGARVTLTLLFGGIVLAYVVGAALGAASAGLGSRRADVGVGIAVVALHATPCAALAAIVLALGADRGGMFWPVVLVAVGLLATPARQQRTGLAEVMTRDFVRALRARGMGPLRALGLHGVRHAALTTVTMLTIEPPVALAAVFVVEAAFGLDGIGAAVVDAVATRDTSFLMILALAAAVVASMVVFVSDVVRGLLDPRMRGRTAEGNA